MTFDNTSYEYLNDIVTFTLYSTAFDLYLKNYLGIYIQIVPYSKSDSIPSILFEFYKIISTGLFNL